MICIPSSLPAQRVQRGAASLIVVMLLFFLMLLVTAYASRSLLFEQRTSANQYHATQAAEAAEAGLQWTLAMINGGRIDDNCMPSTTPGQQSFRDRYLTTDAFGNVTPKPAWPPSVTVAACVRLTAGWTCRCSPSGNANLDAVVDANPPTAPAPSFGVSLAGAGAAGMLSLQVAGCAGVDSGCQPTSVKVSDARARHAMVVAPLGLANLPVAALATNGAVATSAPFVAVNDEVAGSGIAVQMRTGFAAANAVLSGPPGTPYPVASAGSGSDDATAYFISYFGMTPAKFGELPTVLNLATCGDCTARITTGLAAGNRVYRVGGDLTLSNGTTLGTADEPVLLIVDGTLTVTGNVNIVGLVYGSQVAWNGTGSVRGAVITNGDWIGPGTPTLIFDSGVLKRISALSTSLLPVPGSWRDGYQ